MKIIAIYIKPQPEPQKQADELARWLSRQGVTVVQKMSSPPQPGVDLQDLDTAPPEVECIVVLGGDGTFLSAARWAGKSPIPILGVKFGEVGFLSEINQDALYSVVGSVVDGDYQVEERSRLAVRVMEDGRQVTEQLVLNDVVLNNATLARLAHIPTWVDGEYLTTYRADGLIVATPTGSTAYNLAAGGPVIHPAVAAHILTPICPFTLTNRPLIVPDTAVIRLGLEYRGADVSGVTITFDGQAGMPISHNHAVLVEKSEHPVRLVKLPAQSYFDVLKAKLRWSGGKQ
ncbi:MAG: NAD(+)/NADH kinase [Deltaproteobacteria bacterium]|nr:NAD(+)/NADH kinase [Deltaproteobacteria bacterium]